MATRVLPDTLRPGVLPDVWGPLTEFLATVKTGDVVENPWPDATFPCDKKVPIPHVGVRFMWEGAVFQQRTLRPYGQTRNDVTIAGGTHLMIPTGTPLIPSDCNWGYVNGPGIPAGTQIVLDYNRRGGVLSNECLDGVALPIVFTSKLDRGRCGFEITGKDVELHDAKWRGPVEFPTYTRYLEAQHGVYCAGASGIKLVNISSEHMQADHLYLGAVGSRVSSFVEATGGTALHEGRSGIVPNDCADCTVESMVIADVNRTVVDVEPPTSACKVDRFKLCRTIIGKHQLTLLSSGGDLGAHVGSIELSDCWMTNDDMPLWLVKGDAQHLRGPYFILRNKTTYANPFGASYPTAALICIDHARPGSKVIDNKGIKLQTGRSPGMATVRSQHAGTVEVHGNDHDGGIEVGPWI